MPPSIRFSRRACLKALAAATVASPHLGLLAGQASGATPAADSLDLAVFRDPGCQYRGVTLWFLNDRLEIDEAIRQLRGFREAGWGAVITRTFMGIRTPYLSPEWLTLTDRVVDVSRELGMRVFLQHADKNAAGYMASGVPGMQERFRHKLLVRAPAGDPPPPKSVLLGKNDKYAYYHQVVVPDGDWAQLMAVLDLLDEETVAAYLKAAYDPLAQRYGREFGKTVEAVWVDEPWLRINKYTKLPILPWTTRLPELFQREWGYSILDHLPSLFAEVGDFQKIRYHFWRTVNKQFHKAYWEPVGQWCQSHGTQFAGHLMLEDTLGGQISWTGSVMPSYEVMQLPGIDHLTKNLESWPAGTKFIVTPKQCSSAANQLGRKEVLAEMYGVSDQALTFEERKWIAEWMAVLGVNYRCYHGSFYSMRGRRKRFYPPHLSYQQPWWPDNRLIADPMARLSYILRQGKFEADILVLHPLESAHTMFTPAGNPPAVQSLQRSWAALSEHLLAVHRSYDFGDEHLMSKFGRVEGGRLHVGEMAYRVVILPELVTLRSSTVRLLTALLDAGGLVCSVGTLPSRIDGAADPRIKQLTDRVIPVENSAEALGRVLAERHPADFELTGDGAERVWAHTRRVGDKRVLFFSNTKRTAGTETQLRIRGRGKLEAWNLVSGQPEAVPQESCDGWVVAPLRFETSGSHLLVFDEKASPKAVKLPSATETRSISLAPRFSVKRRDPNVVTLDFCRYRCGEGAWSERIPVIGVLEKLTDQGYTGPIELQFQFQAADRPATCEVVVEDSEECQITINGQTVRRSGSDYYWDRGFHRIPITEHVKTGENEIVVRRRFVPGDAKAIRDPERLYGTELESIYVIGDFAVNEPQPGQFVLAAESGAAGRDLVSAGYPFYTGRIVVAKELELPPPASNERVLLDLGPLQAVLAKVRVNGREMGAITWAPYQADITQAVHAGANRVEIELISSLRNLLGPHHYRGPRKLEVWDQCFTARSERVDWMNPPERQRLKTWSDTYAFAPLGVAENARIVYQRT